MKASWKDTPLAHRIVCALSIIVGAAVILLAILQIFDIWTQAVNLCVPLMGVNLLCQTYIQWNTSRKSAYVSLCCAILVFACAIAVFLLP